MSNNKKPNYITRPSKHIERKIFVEAFQCLSKANYHVSDYHYIGFGCYYYMDFILFHRYLSINKMTCLENDVNISKRMKFNKPFKFINLKIQDFSSYVSTLRNDKKYLVWIDYEKKLDREILTNIKSLVNTLKNESIIIITVNADLKEMQDFEFLESKDINEIREKQNDNLVDKCKEQFFPFCGTITKIDTTPKEYPRLCAETIGSAIKNGLSGRQEDDFYQLFNYIYQDGTRMLTIGGIVDRKNKSAEIKKSLRKLDFINYNNKPTIISIPPLTLREKLYLDQKISKKGKLSLKLPFEIRNEEIKDYIKFSKHYPSFYEVLMT